MTKSEKYSIEATQRRATQVDALLVALRKGADTMEVDDIETAIDGIRYLAGGVCISLRAIASEGGE